MLMLAITTAATMLGRLNLGVVGKYVQDEFALNPQTMGWIFSAFAIAYGSFQIPGGWAGDRFGARKVLTVSLLFWSLATISMVLLSGTGMGKWIGVAWSFAFFRFLLGVGEAPTSPCNTKVVVSWMGPLRRGVGSSFHIAGIGLGGALTPVVLTLMAQRWGWRTCFYFSGLVGILVAMGWWFYATDRPEEHPKVNAAELAIIRSQRMGFREEKDLAEKRQPPWLRMLSRRTVWAIVLSYFCQGYMAYIYVTWFFIYLVRARGLSMLKGGVGGAAPFLAMMLLAPLGGWLSDCAVHRFGKRRGRQSTVWLGMGCSALLLWIGSHTVNNTAAICMLALAAGFNYFALPSWWATCIDITPTYSASLSGLMNAFAGGWLSPIVTAYLATHFGWKQALDFAALLTAIGGLLWIFVDASENLDKRSNAEYRAPLST
jgi:ACS family glucarate transporter-like MFS transporter